MSGGIFYCHNDLGDVIVIEWMGVTYHCQTQDDNNDPVDTDRPTDRPHIVWRPECEVSSCP